MIIDKYSLAIGILVTGIVFLYFRILEVLFPR